MPIRYDINHTTVYRYRQPVRFGEHRVMFRPRDSHDLEHYLRPYHDDPDGELTAWARQFIRTDGATGTRDLLVAMNQHIRDTFRYVGRDEEGTQSPTDTLRLGSGSCRDFALLMME